MTEEKIKEILKNYDELDTLARVKIRVLQDVDDWYDTPNGIEEITFELNLNRVCVRFDESWGGCNEWNYFSFPISYLILDDEELTEVAKKDRLKRLEEKKVKEENDRLEALRILDAKDLEQYKRLKKKFES